MAKRKDTQKVDAIVDSNGRVFLSRPVRFDGPRRAVLTILVDEPATVSETALLSEPALAQDWDRPEEDEAWATLQSDQ